jgi:hypothetical protein
MPSSALQRFAKMMVHVDQLINIHGQLRGGPGRRYEQDALHRAGVVFVVAAWESYIEQVLIEGFAAIERDAGAGVGAAAAPNWARHALGLRKIEIARAAKRLNTPDATGVRDLLRETLGFNPWDIWQWQARRRQWNAEEMRRRLNGWLQVRHSIAHGSELPTNVEWCMDTRGRPCLNLPQLRECRKYFNYIAKQTDDALRAFLVREHGVVNPW